MSNQETENQEAPEVAEDIESEEVEDAEVEGTDEEPEAKAEELPKPEDIENAVPKGKNISTLSTTEGMPEGWFDNYGTPDLRTYLKFWEDEKRSAGKAEHLLATEPEKWAWLPDREAHVKALREEIALREAKRSQGGPGSGPRVAQPAPESTEEASDASDADEMTDEELEAATAPVEAA